MRSAALGGVSLAIPGGVLGAAVDYLRRNSSVRISNILSIIIVLKSVLPCVSAKEAHIRAWSVRHFFPFVFLAVFEKGSHHQRYF